MKIHLRILYGCDDRLEYVKDCVEVCKDYFDSIGITNSGPKEFYDKLSNTFDSNISINHLNNFLDIETKWKNNHNEIIFFKNKKQGLFFINNNIIFVLLTK